MRNVLPLAFTRMRGSFFNVAAITRPRPNDRLTTVGHPPIPFSISGATESAEGYIKDQGSSTIQSCEAPSDKTPEIIQFPAH